MGDTGIWKSVGARHRDACTGEERGELKVYGRSRRSMGGEEE